MYGNTFTISDEDYNHANVIIDMYGNTFTIDDNDNIIPHDDDDDNNNKPITIQAAQRQINAVLTGRTTASSITAFTNQAKREYDEFFSLKKNANCTRLVIPTSPLPILMQMMIMMHSCTINGIINANKNKTSTVRPGTNKTTPVVNSKTVAHVLTKIPANVDLSTTYTLEALCKLDTIASNKNFAANDMLINFMI